MANELEDELKISQEILTAPLVLSKNLEEVYNVALKISGNKGIETSINKSVTASKKLRDETTKLTNDTTALVGVQKALSKAIEDDAKAYAQENKVIQDLNKTTVANIANNDKQVKELKARRQELQASKASFAQLNTEQARATKEGQDLLKTMQQQDAEIAKLREELEKKNKTQEKEVSALTKLKQTYKDLQSEMIKVAEESGVESEAFLKVAEEAGKVRDEIGDLSEATKSVSGEPIERLAGSFDLFKGKLATLDLKGATAGIKGMSSAAQSLTFKGAIDGAGGLTKAVGALGKALLTNPIFLIIAVVVGIGAAIFALKDKVKFLSDAFDAMGEALDWIIQLAKDLGDAIGLTTFAIDDATVKIVEDLEKQRKKWEELYDDQIKLLGAAGKKTAEAETAKQKAIAETTRLAIERLEYQRQAGSKLTEDQEKQLAELVKANHDANIEIVAIALRTQKELDDLAKEEEKKRKERALREAGDAFKLQQFLLQNEIENQKKIAADDTKTFDARFDAVDKLIAKQRELAALELDQGFNAEDATPSARKLAEAKYQQDITDITAEAAATRTAIIKSNQDQELKNTEEFVAARKKEIAQNVQNDINEIDRELQAYTQSLIDKGFKSEESDKLLAAKRKELIDDYIQAEIDGQRKILEIDQLTGDDRIAAEQKLTDLKIQLTNAYYDNLEDREKTWQEKALAFIDKWKGAYQQFSQGIADLFAANTAKRLQQLDIESAAIKDQADELSKKNKEDEDDALKRSVDNAEIQASIKEAFAAKDKSIKEQAAKQEERIEQQRKQATIRQARLDKAIALSNAAINLAGAIIAMLEVGPAGFALSAAAAAIGAVQLAVIAAQPIPAAEKGIRGHKGGKILAGEKGHELIEMPGGKLALTDNTPHIYDLPAGTNIYPHTDPKSINAVAGKNLPIYRQDRPAVKRDPDVVNELKNITRAVKSKKTIIVHGVITGSIEHDTYIKQRRNGR